MAQFAASMMNIALELAKGDPVYEDVACKFFEHYVQISEAINGTDAESGLWCVVPVLCGLHVCVARTCVVRATRTNDRSHTTVGTRRTGSTTTSGMTTMVLSCP